MHVCFSLFLFFFYLFSWSWLFSLHPTRWEEIASSSSRWTLPVCPLQHFFVSFPSLLLMALCCFPPLLSHSLHPAVSLISLINASFACTLTHFFRSCSISLLCVLLHSSLRDDAGCQCLLSSHCSQRDKLLCKWKGEGWERGWEDKGSEEGMKIVVWKSDRESSPTISEKNIMP